MTSVNMQTYLRLRERAEFSTDLTSEKSEKAMLEVFTPDFQIVEPPSLPHGGVHTGRDEWVAMHHTMRDIWEQKVDVQHMWDVPDDDLIVLYAAMEWTARETGKTARFPVVELLHFRDGLIARVELFLQDTKVVLDTLEKDRP